jgi:hypothetical protein
MTPLSASAANCGQERQATQLATHTTQSILPGTDSLARVIQARVDALRRRIALQSSALPNRRSPLLCDRQLEVLPRARSGPHVLAAQLRAAAIQTRLQQAFIATANLGGLSNFDRNLQQSSLVQNRQQRSVAIPSSVRTRVDISHHAPTRASIIAELERRLILDALRRNTSHC